MSEVAVKRYRVWILLGVLASVAMPGAEQAGRIERIRVLSRMDRAIEAPEGSRAILNVAYGRDPAQRFDIWLPADARNAPVLFYVHGGGWANGNKTNPGIENKLAYWVSKGYAVVSTNYRLVPHATPQQQVEDVASAVAAVQDHAREWGLDATRVVLMGHSAGAHLVALLGADPSLLTRAGAQRPLGAVSLDSGALDVAALMSQLRVPALYRDAFGSDPQFWASVSPQAQLKSTALPMLLVCSGTRQFPTSPCAEARAFAARASGMGVSVEVLPEALDHGEINKELGLPSTYTREVSRFIDSL